MVSDNASPVTSVLVPSKDVGSVWYQERAPDLGLKVKSNHVLPLFQPGRNALFTQHPDTPVVRNTGKSEHTPHTKHALPRALGSS